MLRRPTRLLLALAAPLVLAIASASAQGTATLQDTTIRSPRLTRLQRDVSRGDKAALTGFWNEVKRDGAPLIESTRGDNERLVTFLYRSTRDARVVLLTDFADYIPHYTLKRLPGTDVWYRSIPLPADSRFLYEISVNDPAYPFVDGDEVKYPSAPTHDSLNPRRWEYAKPQILSLVELPGALSLELSRRDSTVLRGSIGAFDATIKSVKLGNERRILVYRPARYTDSAAPYPLLVFGASYFNQIRLPIILDNLIARKRIPPVVAVFIDYPSGAQDTELGCDDAYGDFVATELLPWVRDRVRVTNDPQRTIIGGASAGGHSAACVALQHPQAIGNVIAQSGAFWRGIGYTAAYWSGPARDDGREGFARLAVNRPTAPVRYYLTIGLLERGQAFSADAVSMIHASRHVRDVLRAKGYDVTLREINGGHDPYNWEATLPDALIALLGSGSTAR